MSLLVDTLMAIGGRLAILCHRSRCVRGGWVRLHVGPIVDDAFGADQIAQHLLLLGVHGVADIGRASTLGPLFDRLADQDAQTDDPGDDQGQAGVEGQFGDQQ